MLYIFRSRAVEEEGGREGFKLGCLLFVSMSSVKLNNIIISGIGCSETA